MADEAIEIVASATRQLAKCESELATLRAALETHRTCLAENVAEMERAAEEIATLRAALARAEADMDATSRSKAAEAETAKRDIARLEETLECVRRDRDKAEAERDEATEEQKRLRVCLNEEATFHGKTIAERDEAQRLILAYTESATTENAGALWRYGRELMAKGAK